MNIRKAFKEDMHWINEQYDAIDFVRSDFDNEFIAIVEDEKQKAGIGRLVNIVPGVKELGGMFVTDGFRNKGIARQIVHFLLDQCPPTQTIYCVAFDHLVDFYKSCGFEDTKFPKQAPKEVISKIDWCQTQYPHRTTLLAINEAALLLGK